MTKLWWLLLVVACDAGQKPKPPPKPTPTPPPAETCQFDGNYKLRFHANTQDGWWLYLKVAANKAEVTGGALDMLALPAGPIATAVDVKTYIPESVVGTAPPASMCVLTLTAHTKRTGDLKITLSLAVDNSVGGQLSRTLGGDRDQKAETTRIEGVRETKPPELPDCVKPGIYEIKAAPKTKWKLDGHPRSPLNCNMELPNNAIARVRISTLRSEIIVDEVDDQNQQSFSRGVVTRNGDCSISLDLEVQDFRFTGAKIALGSVLTGTFADATWQFMEDGNAGENLWKCNAQNAGLIGTRVAD